MSEWLDRRQLVDECLAGALVASCREVVAHLRQLLVPIAVERADALVVVA